MRAKGPKPGNPSPQDALSASADSWSARARFHLPRRRAPRGGGAPLPQPIRDAGASSCCYKGLGAAAARPRARSAQRGQEGGREGGRGERTEHRAPGRPGGGAAARGSARARALFHPLPSAGHPGPGHLRARTGLRPTSGPRGARPHRGPRSGHTRGRPGRTPAGEPSAPEERTTPGAALHADRTRRSGPAQRAPPWGKWRHRWQQDQAHGPLPAPDQDPGGAREPLQQHWRRRVLRVGSGQDHGAEPRLRVCELLRARRCRRSRPHPQRPRTAGEDRQDSARDSSSHLSCARSPPGGGGGSPAVRGPGSENETGP